VYPTVKTLQTQLRISRETALKVRKVLDGRLDPETFESVSNWVRQCYHKPRTIDLKLKACDEILETFGVESIEDPNAYVDPYHMNFTHDYLNTGDSYAATLIRDNRTGRVFVGSWGDIAERQLDYDHGRA
jgi:hypothetical protein